jgi:hypothetical protein
MRHVLPTLFLAAAVLAFAAPARAQTTVEIQGTLDSQLVWRWVDAGGTKHDSADALGTTKNVTDPAQRLIGRLVVPVKNGDKVRFAAVGSNTNVKHGVLFENGQTETAGTAPVWSRLSGSTLSPLPGTSPFSEFDTTTANLTPTVAQAAMGAEIIEIEVKNLKEGQPIFFACRVHSAQGGTAMFGALVLDTPRNLAAVRRVVANTRLVSTGVSDKLSWDEALKNAVAKLPPNPFPNGIRTFSVVEIKGTIGGISGKQEIQVTIIAQDGPSHASGIKHGETTQDAPAK